MPQPITEAAPSAGIRPGNAGQHLRRWWWLYLAIGGLLLLGSSAAQHGSARAPGRSPTVGGSAESPAQQWQDAETTFQRVNNQLIAAQGSAAPSAATFADIDAQAQALNAVYQGLPSVPGGDDSISNEVRDATAQWASGIHTIAKGVSTGDVGLIQAGNADLLVTATEITAADARLKTSSP